MCFYYLAAVHSYDLYHVFIRFTDYYSFMRQNSVHYLDILRAAFTDFVIQCLDLST